MAVGKPVDKLTIDTEIANMGVQFNYWFGRVQRFTATLDAMADNTFTSTGIPKSPSDPTLVTYTAPELTSLRNAYRDLDKLRQVFMGTYYVTAGATVNTGVPTANDGTHFGYPFYLAVSTIDGLGY